jgi:hypothetical protein
MMATARKTLPIAAGRHSETALIAARHYDQIRFRFRTAKTQTGR